MKYCIEPAFVRRWQELKNMLLRSFERIEDVMASIIFLERLDGGLSSAHNLSHRN